MATKPEAKLKARLKQEVSSPNFEVVWRSLKRRDLVDMVLDGIYEYEELVADAEEAVDIQQETLLGEGRTGKPPGPEKGRPVEPLPAQLSEYEREHMEALSAYYGAAAAAQAEVQRLRNSILPEGFLTREQARMLLTSPAAALLSFRTFERREISLIGHTAQLISEDWYTEENQSHYIATVLISPPELELTVGADHDRRRPALRPLHYVDAKGNADWVRVLRGSLLDQVRRVSERLARRYGWEEAEATHFILTGEHPTIPPLKGRPGVRSVTLEIAPYVSSQTVSRVYLQLQHQAGYNRQHTAKGARVLRFVLEQVKTEGMLPPWSELTRRWNETHPKERYNSRFGLQKAYDRAFDEIIKPHWALSDLVRLEGVIPGVPKPSRS
jgi:hypothetical protein